MTIEATIRAARRRFSEAGFTTPGLDARVLAQEAFGLDAAGLIAHGDGPTRPDLRADFERMVDRRLGGEPVGRILGRREFHGLPFALSADTLEPRPDTETLVDFAIALVRRGGIPGVAPDGTGLLFADIGTGTGAIAVALAVALPGARGIATDIAPGALATAAGNAALNHVADRIVFRLGDYLEPLTERCGLIVSNPPYIESADVDALAREVRDHDPRRALDGGADGLVAYRRLAAAVSDRLAPGGAMAVEIGSRQAGAVMDLFSAAGLAELTVHTDIAGIDRVVTARAP